MWVSKLVDEHQLVEEDGVWNKAGRAVVALDDALRKEILTNSHNHPAAGHPRIKKTLLAVARNYWWPKMGEFIMGYVKGCSVCQATKASMTKLHPSLFSISPESTSLPFSTIALNLIMDLPLSQGYDSILTVTDHDVSKATIFLPCLQTITREGVAALFATHIFPHFRVSKKVISNHDT